MRHASVMRLSFSPETKSNLFCFVIPRRLRLSPRRWFLLDDDLSSTEPIGVSLGGLLVSLPLLDENPSLSLFSTIPCMSPSPRRRRVSISLRLSSNQKVIICSYVLLSCMSLIRLLLVLISCLICFVGLILSRGGSLRRRRSSLRWLSSDQKVKFLIHVLEQMVSEIVVLLLRYWFVCSVRYRL